MRHGWLLVAMLGCGKKQDMPAGGSAAPPPSPTPGASTTCTAASTPTQLAQGKLQLVAADDSGAYITEDVAQGAARLSRVDAKGTTMQLATDPASIASVRAFGDVLYFRAFAQLKRVAKTGGDASQLPFTAGGPPGDLIGADASQLYFVRRDKGVFKTPLAGGAAEQAIKQDAGAFDGQRFISLHDNRVDIISPDGTATTLVTIPKGTFLESPLAFDGSYIYYATKEPGANQHTGIQRVAVSGGAPQTIAAGEDAATLGVGGGFVYWSLTRATTEVHRAPIAGGPIATVACLHTRGAIDLAATAAGVFFTNRGDDGKGAMLLFSAKP